MDESKKNADATTRHRQEKQISAKNGVEEKGAPKTSLLKDEKTAVAMVVDEKKEQDDGNIDTEAKDGKKEPSMAHHECITQKDEKNAGAAKKHEKTKQKHDGPDTPAALEITSQDVKPKGAVPEAKPEVRVVNEIIGEKEQPKTTSASKTETRKTQGDEKIDENTKIRVTEATSPKPKPEVL